MAFLEQTLRSVLLQGYPNLEYIVIDGGSTDGSIRILERYAPWLTYWVSESDNGQVDAINKGLRRSSSDWIGWQNSDDIYYPLALWRIAEAARRDRSAALIVGNVNLIASDDRVITDLRFVRPTYRSMLAEGMVLTNQAAFWRREIACWIGWLDEAYGCAFDYDWFLRVLDKGLGPAFWQADLDEAAGLLVEVIREMRPQVVVTYDDERRLRPPRPHPGPPGRDARGRAGGRPGPFGGGEPWQVAKVYWNAMPESVLRDGIRAAARGGRHDDLRGHGPRQRRCRARRPTSW